MGEIIEPVAAVGEPALIIIRRRGGLSASAGDVVIAHVRQAVAKRHDPRDPVGLGLSASKRDCRQRGHPCCFRRECSQHHRFTDSLRERLIIAGLTHCRFLLRSHQMRFSSRSDSNFREFSRNLVAASSAGLHHACRAGPDRAEQVSNDGMLKHNTLSFIDLRWFVPGLAGSDRPVPASFASSDPGGLESTALEPGGPSNRRLIECAAVLEAAVRLGGLTRPHSRQPLTRRRQEASGVTTASLIAIMTSDRSRAGYLLTHHNI